MKKYLKAEFENKTMKDLEVNIMIFTIQFSQLRRFLKY